MKKYFFLFLLFFFSLIIVSSLGKIHAQVSCPTNPTSTNAITTTVTISQTGNYKVWTRLNAPNTTTNSYFLQIDDGCAFTIGDSSAIPTNTWTWVDYQNGTASNPVIVSLAAGEHTIKLIEREGGVSIDRILFAADTTCTPVGTGEVCEGPTATPQQPTAAPTPINSPTPTPTVPVPTVAPSMTVTTISMSSTRSGSNRDVKTTITVRREQTNAAVSDATVTMRLRTPSGTMKNFSGTTSSNGQVSFTNRSRERGTYQATVTNVTKAGLIYHPTNTTKTLTVN